MAATLFALSLAFGGAAVSVYAADPDWARSHGWLGPLFTIAAAIFLLSAAVVLRARRSKRLPSTPLPTTAQEAHGHSSPNIIATNGSSVIVGFGTQQNPESETRPFVRPVEYCERINGEYLRVINEGERAYDLYTEPLTIGDWVLDFHRLPDLKGEGQINALRLTKTQADKQATVLSSLQKLESAWVEVEKANPNFSKPWIRVHYHDHRNRQFISQCRITRFRDPSGNASFRLTNFSDDPVKT